MRKTRTNPTEKEVTRQCNDWLKLAGLTPYRRNNQLVKRTYKGKDRYIRSGVKGQADWWLILPGSGRHVEIEYKRPGEWPKPEQVRWLIDINMRGGVGFWACRLSHVVDAVAHIRNGGSIDMLIDGTYRYV